MGFEPTTFCMASRRSSQLSYSRAATDDSREIALVASVGCAGRAWAGTVAPSARAGAQVPWLSLRR